MRKSAILRHYSRLLYLRYRHVVFSGKNALILQKQILRLSQKKKYRPSADDVPGLAMDGTGRHEIYNAAGDQVVYCSHYNSKVRNKEEQICPGALVRFKQKHLYIAIYGTPMSSEKEICEFARSINLQ